MRLKGAALKSAGVATHAVPSDQLDALTDALAGVSSATDVAGTLAQFDTLPAEPAIDDPTRVKLLAMFEVRCGAACTGARRSPHTRVRRVTTTER